MTNYRAFCTFCLLFGLLFVAELVEARRVIRAVPGVNTTGNYIVVLNDNITHSRYEEILEEIRKETVGVDVYEKIEGKFAKLIAAKISERSAHKIKLLDDVEFVEEESYAKQSISWALDRLDQESSQLDNSYSPYGDGEGTDVYILDTGINYNHNDFGGRAKYPGRDPVDDAERENRRGADCDGHGTHVASLAIGTLYGVAKKANAYSVRVLDCSGSAPWSVIIDGLNYAAEQISSRNRPAVISMSLGGSFSNSVDRTVRNVIGQGIPVVAAAGNERDDACDYSPASSAGVITVGGTAQGDNVYFSSNGGSCVDILAPGSSVLAAYYSCNTCTATFSGTSMATPIVSGAVAIILQKDPNLTPAQIRNKLVTESLKDKLDYSNLARSLRSSTPNRMLYIQAVAATTSTVTQTVTTTARQTVTLTSTSVLTSTTTRVSTSTRSVTFTATSVSTSIAISTTSVTSTLIVPTTTWFTTIVPSTVIVTTTFQPSPTPTGVCCMTLDDIRDNSTMPNITSIIANKGISMITDIVKRNNCTIPIGKTPDTAVKSCSDLLSLSSGMYWVKTSGGVKEVYCELEKDIRNNRGFARIANVNMSVPGTECPGDLSLRVDGGLRTCQRGQSQPGCTSAYFNSTGMEYSLVCGRVRGYQWASPNAFYIYNRFKTFTIDSHYVDGVVLTYHNNSHREHIWTFAAALDEVRRTTAFACQCTNKDVTIRNFETPPFVGDDYFCETGSRNNFRYGTFYTSDPLWDGAGCGAVNTCCERGEWFCKDVPRTTSDIELRLCGNEPRSNEDTPLEIIELYVK